MWIRLGEFFAMHEYNFENTNTCQLIGDVANSKDGEMFNVDIGALNWDEYIKQYILGIRKYVLKDDECTLAAARTKMNR